MSARRAVSWGWGQSGQRLGQWVASPGPGGRTCPAVVWGRNHRLGPASPAPGHALWASPRGCRWGAGPACTGGGSKLQPRSRAPGTVWPAGLVPWISASQSLQAWSTGGRHIHCHKGPDCVSSFVALDKGTRPPHSPKVESPARRMAPVPSAGFVQELGLLSEQTVDFPPPSVLGEYGHGQCGQKCRCRVGICTERVMERSGTGQGVGRVLTDADEGRPAFPDGEDRPPGLPLAGPCSRLPGAGHRPGAEPPSGRAAQPGASCWEVPSA